MSRLFSRFRYNKPHLSKLAGRWFAVSNKSVPDDVHAVAAAYAALLNNQVTDR